MRNPKPRFALEDDGRLYDYVAARYIKAEGVVEDQVGIWDLQKVADLIVAGKSIEAALTLHTDPNPATDRVDQANADFDKEPLGDGVTLSSISHQSGELLSEDHEISEESLETIEIDVEGEPRTKEQRAAREQEKLEEEAGQSGANTQDKKAKRKSR